LRINSLYAEAIEAVKALAAFSTTAQTVAAADLCGLLAANEITGVVYLEEKTLPIGSFAVEAL
jgi:hypothetical protein